MLEKKSTYVVNPHLNLQYDDKPSVQDVRARLQAALDAMTDAQIAAAIHEVKPEYGYLRLTRALGDDGLYVYGTQFNSRETRISYQDFLKLPQGDQQTWITSVPSLMCHLDDAEYDVFVHETRLTDDLVTASLDIDYEDDEDGFVSFYDRLDLRPYLEAASDEELVSAYAETRLPMTSELSRFLQSQTMDTMKLQDHWKVLTYLSDEIGVTPNSDEFRDWLERHRPHVLEMAERNTVGPSGP